jgi:hypothetical protein
MMIQTYHFGYLGGCWLTIGRGESAEFNELVSQRPLLEMFIELQYYPKQNPRKVPPWRSAQVKHEE